jgi:hypothetical protein
MTHRLCIVGQPSTHSAGSPAPVAAIGTLIDVRPGWVVEPLRWNGQDQQVGYDPRRHDIMRVCRRVIPGSAAHVEVADDVLDSEVGSFPVVATDAGLAGELQSGGYQRAATDSAGYELWIRDRAAVATARLDRLRDSAEPAPPSVALS